MIEDIYTTSDQGLAAYLMELGFYCVKAVSAEDPRFPERKNLIFVDVTDPKKIEDDWFRYRKQSISAKSYFEKLRAVRHIVRNGLDEEDLKKLREKTNADR